MPNTFSVKYSENNFPLIEMEISSPVSNVADNVTQAQEIAKKIEDIFNQNPDKNFFVLVDISKLGLSGNYPSPQARNIYMNLLKSNRIIKIAFIAPTLLLKSIIRFISSAEVANKMITVNTKQEGIDWLSHEND